MKLYHFNPNTYGTEYFVMARNIKDAYESLIKHLRSKLNDVDYGEMYLEELNIWLSQNPEDLSFGKYTIDSYEEGEIIKSEIA